MNCFQACDGNRWRIQYNDTLRLLVLMPLSLFLYSLSLSFSLSLTLTNNEAFVNVRFLNNLSLPPVGIVYSIRRMNMVFAILGGGLII